MLYIVVHDDFALFEIYCSIGIVILRNQKEPFLQDLPCDVASYDNQLRNM
jgi:hypothetical protein